MYSDVFTPCFDDRLSLFGPHFLIQLQLPSPHQQVLAQSEKATKVWRLRYVLREAPCLGCVVTSLSSQPSVGSSRINIVDCYCSTTPAVRTLLGCLKPAAGKSTAASILPVRVMCQFPLSILVSHFVAWATCLLSGLDSYCHPARRRTFIPC